MDRSLLGSQLTLKCCIPHSALSRAEEAHSGAFLLTEGLPSQYYNCLAPIVSCCHSPVVGADLELVDDADPDYSLLAPTTLETSRPAGPDATPHTSETSPPTTQNSSPTYQNAPVTPAAPHSFTTPRMSQYPRQERKQPDRLYPVVRH